MNTTNPFESTRLVDLDTGREAPANPVDVITPRWLQRNIRDSAFANWFCQKWPDGARLEEIIEEIEHPDWLLMLLAKTRFRPDTALGKRMLILLVLACVKQAVSMSGARELERPLGAVERWLKVAGDFQRALAGNQAERLEQQEKDRNFPTLESYSDWAVHAAREAVKNALLATQATTAPRIRKFALWAVAAAMSSAYFAAASEHANRVPSTLQVDLNHLERTAHRFLCRTMKHLIAPARRTPSRIRKDSGERRA